MICYADITNLKSDILEKIGQKIIIKGSLGRNKSFEKEEKKERIQEAISKLIYEVSMLYKERNSLLNEFTKGFESGEPICIKVPAVTDDYEVIFEELEFKCS